MDPRFSNAVNRRTALKSLAAGGAIAIAGCGEMVDEDPEPEPTPTPDEETPTPEEEREETDDPLQELVAIFDDQPMNDDQQEIDGARRDYTPRHVWKWVSEESFIGLHFDEPNPEEATALDYITVGRKGLFTEESQPGSEFTHFHQHTADSWDGGHGSQEGDEGYWLTHMAVREIQYPFHDEPISPRVDYDFMPTPPPAGSTGTSADFAAPNSDEGSLPGDTRDALIEVFDYQPFNDDQHEVAGANREYTPRHLWFDVGDGVVLFLHFNEPNPEEATELDYFGFGIEGQYTAEDIPVAQTQDFTHFHQADAEGWDAGHGGQDTGDAGYWLVHHSVREVQYPFHDEPTDIGVDREFMPTPAPDA